MKKVFNKIDKPLFFLTIISLIFGVMMVLSASSLKAFMVGKGNYFYFQRQLFFIALGLFAGFIIILIPSKTYTKHTFIISNIWLGILAVGGALLFVLLNDKVMNGISGWMFIGGFGIQPSEFAKTISILFLAVSFEKLMKVRNISIPKKFFPFAIPMVFTMLIFMQPDLGTMIILLGILFVIFCILPIDFKQKSVVAGLALICGLSVLCVMLITGKGFGEVQKQRLNFKEPCTRYRQETGYQVCNGFIAMNSGGLFGSGFGNSKQKYLYLPEAHTDFIFPIIIEETGLITGIIILIVYFIIIWRIIMIGRKSYNLQGMIISYGVAAYISLHIIVNLVGVMGLLPLTGVPLPFYSYGGSFMINLLICLSLVQRVCVENKQFEQKHLVR